MSSKSGFNPHYPAPSAEVLVRLRRSELEAEQITTRDLRCPICNFWVAKIPVKQTDLVFVKCQKCKFQGALSPAYFRRMKRYYREISSFSGGMRGKR